MKNAYRELFDAGVIPPSMMNDHVLSILAKKTTEYGLYERQMLPYEERHEQEFLSKVRAISTEGPALTLLNVHDQAFLNNHKKLSNGDDIDGT